VGNRPRRFALTPDQKELWVSNELSGSVTIINPQTNEIIESIEFLPPGFRPEDVTPVGITMTKDGATTFVALGRANHVAVVDTASREIKDYILVGNRAWNTILNRDNSLLFVANGLSDDISVIDVAKRKVIKSVPVGRVPYMVLIDD
jgi:YVTN family beta-propeller protein